MNIKRYLILTGAAALLLLSCDKPEPVVGPDVPSKDETPEDSVGTEQVRGPFDNEIGKTLSPWAEGCLDIHAINSGRGECTFFIMPDGTTLCCDAGEITKEGSEKAGDHPRVDQKPNANTRPYVTYATYITHFLPEKVNYMDYMLMTHFHNDHFGTPVDASYSQVTRAGLTWGQSGIMALYDMVPFDKMIDRAYSPNDTKYEFVAQTGKNYSSGYGQYADFIYWARSAKGLKVERAKLGSTSQIKLVNDPSAYPDFVVEVNAVNGYVKGETQEDTKQIAENGTSISFLMSYGNFDYLTSGDGGTNTVIGAPLAHAINKKIEAMKAHHHFAWDTMSEEIMKIYQPKVVVSQSFYDHQPDMGHDWRCYGSSYELSTSHEFQNAWKAYGEEGDKNWYFTNIHPKVAEMYPSEVIKMKSRNGHVVIRVKEGGDEFYVYVLDDNDFEYKVLQIDGPFTCHAE